MSSSKRSPLPAVTGVRFFLALWVIALHMTTVNIPFRDLVSHCPSFVGKVIAAGASAVGVFFLLSGFVLAYNYDLGKKWDAAVRLRFWAARLARIYPVYLLAVFLAIPSLIAGIVKAHSVDRYAVTTGLAAMLLLLQAWIPNDALFLVGPAWSLSAEAFFYICFPFLGKLLWKIERRSLNWLALAGLWLTACLTSYLIAIWKAPFFLSSALPETAWTEVIKFDPAVRLPEFLAGVVLCRIFLSLEQRKPSSSLLRNGTFLSLCGLAAGMFALSHVYQLPPALLHDGLLLPATATIILGLSLGGGWLVRWLSRPRIVLLGQMSYAMYLLHLPLYSFAAAANKRLVHNRTEAGISFVLYLAVLLGVCYLAFYKIEEPSRRAILKKLFPNKPTPEPKLVAADPF